MQIRMTRQARPGRIRVRQQGDPHERMWTIIGVRDVPGSFHWYQSLFGQPETSPAHADFGQILDSDGTVLLCLHEWGAHEHPSLMSPNHAQPGNGLLLFVRVNDFDGAAEGMRSRRSARGGAALEPKHGTKEFSLHDPDGITSRSVRCLRPDTVDRPRVGQQ